MQDEARVSVSPGITVIPDLNEQDAQKTAKRCSILCVCWVLLEIAIRMTPVLLAFFLLQDERPQYPLPTPSILSPSTAPPNHTLSFAIYCEERSRIARMWDMRTAILGSLMVGLVVLAVFAAAAYLNSVQANLEEQAEQESAAERVHQAQLGGEPLPEQPQPQNMGQQEQLRSEVVAMTTLVGTQALSALTTFLSQVYAGTTYKGMFICGTMLTVVGLAIPTCLFFKGVMNTIAGMDSLPYSVRVLLCFPFRLLVVTVFFPVGILELLLGVVVLWPFIPAGIYEHPTTFLTGAIEKFQELATGWFSMHY